MILIKTYLSMFFLTPFKKIQDNKTNVIATIFKVESTFLFFLLDLKIPQNDKIIEVVWSDHLGESVLMKYIFTSKHNGKRYQKSCKK